MAKYLLKVSYNSEGIAGVMKAGGTSRVTAVKKALTAVGGKLDTFYFAFGDTDVYAIADVPDHATAVAIAAAIGATGTMSSYETIVLITPTEMDAAMKIASENNKYRPPGA
jgi:uncharacterized protein with GYD domain